MTTYSSTITDAPLRAAGRPKEIHWRFLTITKAISAALPNLKPADELSAGKITNFIPWIRRNALSGRKFQSLMEKAEPYCIGGLTGFITEKTETIPDKELAHKIANLVPGKRFVIKEQMFGNTIRPRRRIVFEKPPGFTKMDVPYGNFIHKVLVRGLVRSVPLLPVKTHSGLPPIPRRGWDWLGIGVLKGFWPI
ncbi:hypothetical protein N7516_009440 [Penicillium verrucosum]|uniref:uncharacterized protein n=1 Tax=Penicillium verrucosum TaxID=60171 RepID=UPI00254594D1|nr:uncharacterized protein N7516_009440 [Penicillium verrucosum]KAJ5927667.1 hypothetical protein N7516_009440 [Penicillium verrucosum]